MIRKGKLIDHNAKGTFTDLGGNRFELDRLDGREDEAGVYDTMILESLDGADPQRGTAVCVTDFEGEAEMEYSE